MAKDDLRKDVDRKAFGAAKKTQNGRNVPGEANMERWRQEWSDREDTPKPRTISDVNGSGAQ